MLARPLPKPGSGSASVSLKPLIFEDWPSPADRFLIRGDGARVDSLMRSPSLHSVGFRKSIEFAERVAEPLVRETGVSGGYYLSPSC